MRRLRVLFDGEGFLGPFGGVSHYFAQMIRHLPAEVGVTIAARRTCNLELQAAPFRVAGYPDLYHSFISSGEFRGKWRLWRLAQKLFPWRYPDYEIENRRYLDELLERGEFDVLHLTGAHVYGDAWRRVVGKKPIVITVHDLIPEIVQGDRRIAGFRREILGVVDQVIAVSENTKRDLVRLYGVDEGKVNVIYHGGGQELGLGVRVRSSELGTRDYLLYAGGRGGYKNWAWMVETLVPLLKNGMKLICTGLPFSVGERALLKKLGIEQQVEQRTARQDEFPALYARAAAFVYPSRYEGFGLPILDAWAAGCPVVLARASCFPEIGGEAAEYFELDDAESLRVAVELARAGGLVEKGFERVKSFRWEKCARETMGVYRKMVEAVEI